MSKSNFYHSGLGSLWDPGPLSVYQVSPQTPKLYTDIGKVKYWLWVREGLIALGEMAVNSPLLPDFDIEYWFDDDPNGAACPDCGEDAVYRSDGSGLWCPNCGVAALRS